jgi:predicted Zn-dependent peptidase
MLALVAAVLLLVSGPAAPTSRTAPATSLASEIQEVRLDNGLRIFVLERHDSPTFAANYQFGVGGACDPKGRSGIAHLLEHMLFKGTTTIGTLDHAREKGMIAELDRLWDDLHAELDREADPFRPPDAARVAELRAEIERVSSEQKKLIVKNELDEIVTRAGAVGLNASTSTDVTSYYVQLPANRLELWFKLESDRLLNPVFREFYSERDVVHEERRLRTESRAAGLADEALRGLVFPAHPYGTPIVGWPSDVARLRRTDAMDYYRTYYSPSNCVMVLVGDVTRTDVERLAVRHLGRWKRQVIPPLPLTAELEQRGERRRVVEFDAEPSLAIAWPTVARGHADQAALDLLGEILGGLASSRLDRAIVRAEKIAASASARHQPSMHAGVFEVSSNVATGHAAAEVEAAVDREVRRIQSEGVTTEELERAKVSSEVRRTRGLESNAGVAARIAGAVIASGSPAWLDEYPRRIDAVTAEQVQAAATAYLLPGRKNVVEVRKVAGAGGAAPRGRGEPVAHQHGGTVGERGARHSRGFTAAMATIDAATPVTWRTPQVGVDVRREVLPCGAVVFLKEDHSTPVVQVRMTWKGGSNTYPVEKLGVFEVAGDLLTQGGTESLLPDELEERKEDLGMQLSVSMGATESNATLWALSRNVGLALDLAFDVVTNPRLDAERLAVLTAQHADRMRRRPDVPQQGVALLQRQVLYGDHPRLGYQPSRAEMERLRPDDVRVAWQRYLGNDNVTITIVGDADPDDLLRRVGARLAAWRPAGDASRDFLAREVRTKPGVFVVEKELPQPSVVMTHQVRVDRTAPVRDHAALEILDDILGGSGFRSRLTERVRSDEGLTYGINSGVQHQGRPGVPGGLRIAYNTKKASLAHSIDSVLDEVRKLLTTSVSQAEVDEQVDAWRNRFVFRFTDAFGSTVRLMDLELDDRPHDWDRQVLEAIQAVTVEDVNRVAKEYLRPESLTIAIFGALTPEDRDTLRERWGGVTVLPKSDVFRGGWDDAPPARKPAAPAADAARPEPESVGPTKKAA